MIVDNFSHELVHLSRLYSIANLMPGKISCVNWGMQKFFNVHC